MEILKEELYKKYKLEGLLDDKKLYKKQHDDFFEKGTIIADFKKRFDIKEEEFDILTEKYSDIPIIKSKFTESRKNENTIEKFYNWYKSQNQSCGYCSITQSQLHQLFTNNPETKILPLNNNWSKNDKGTLQIERKNSENNSYHTSNLILACPLCNNAKSNLIDEDSWREIFAEPMKRYYDKLLNKSYGNCVKCGKLATHMHNVHNSWISKPHSEYVPLCDNCLHH